MFEEKGNFFDAVDGGKDQAKGWRQSQSLSLKVIVTVYAGKCIEIHQGKEGQVKDYT